MINFPATYPLTPKNYIQGPTQLWYAPYVAAGADGTGLVAVGAVDKSGFGWDFKQTWKEEEIDQSTTPLESFLTKQDCDIKFTVLELSPGLVNVVLGLAPGTLVGSNPVIQKGGEPFNITDTTQAPNMRPTYRQWIFRFPAPGYDNTTPPVGVFAKWAYVQFWKAYVFQSGEKKFNKDGQTSIAVTLHALADQTITDATNRLFQVVYP